MHYRSYLQYFLFSLVILIDRSKPLTEEEILGWLNTSDIDVSDEEEDEFTLQDNVRDKLSSSEEEENCLSTHKNKVN